jgi:dTMP kinase
VTGTPARGPATPSSARSGEAGGRRGLFVVLEGVEGAGKTTQLRRLEGVLSAAGYPVVPGREPGGTPLGEAVRSILLDRAELALAPESELLLMLAARAAFVRERVGPALASGALFLADRFETSTFAYQGYGRGLPLEEVRRLNAFATGGVRPDLVLVLALPPEAGRLRQRSQGKAADRIEAGGEAFHRRVAQGYEALARSEPATVVVDAGADPDSVQAALLQALAPLLRATWPELHPPAGGWSPGGTGEAGAETP